MRGSLPGERRGGRQKGTPNRSTVLLRDRLAADGVDPADELVKIARAAEVNRDLELAAECWGKLASYIYPKPRPVVLDPDDLVDLECRIAAGRAAATLKEAESHMAGLGERLLRAIAEDLGPPPVVATPCSVQHVVLDASQPVPAPAAPPPSAPPAGPAPSQPAAGDWTPPQHQYSPLLPQRQAFVDADYESMPGGFLSAYRDG